MTAANVIPLPPQLAACPHCGRPPASAGTRFYSPGDLAQRWDEQEHTIRSWIRKGLLRSQKIGPYHKIPGREVDRFELADTEPT